MPGVNGSGGRTWYRPRHMRTSGKLSATALTFTRTWPGPGAGVSTSAGRITSRGSPSSVTCQVFIADLPPAAGRPPAWTPRVPGSGCDARLELAHVGDPAVRVGGSCGVVAGDLGVRQDQELSVAQVADDGLGQLLRRDRLAVEQDLARVPRRGQ